MMSAPQHQDQRKRARSAKTGALTMIIVQARDVRPLLLAFPSEVLGAVLPPRHDVLLAIAVNVVEGSPLDEGDPQPCQQ